MTLINTGEPIYLAKGGKKFRLSEDWEFLSKLMGGRLIVPKGYVSDLASIPQWIWWWQWGVWHLAAICHDYIYEYGYIYKKTNRGLKKIEFSRINADVLFYEVMRDLGVKERTASSMYWAVRAFGWLYWLPHHD